MKQPNLVLKGSSREGTTALNCLKPNRLLCTKKRANFALRWLSQSAPFVPRLWGGRREHCSLPTGASGESCFRRLLQSAGAVLSPPAPPFQSNKRTLGESAKLEFYLFLRTHKFAGLIYSFDTKFGRLKSRYTIPLRDFSLLYQGKILPFFTV